MNVFLLWLSGYVKIQIWVPFVLNLWWFSLVHVLELPPPSYSEEYEDPKVTHPDKAPIYENPTFTLPNELGVNNNAYTGLPGKE